MTFSELYALASAVDPSDDIMVSVEAWRFTHTTEIGGPTWKIYSAKLSSHITGGSGPEVLNKYREAIRPTTPLSPMEQVGDAVIATPTPAPAPEPAPAPAAPGEEVPF